MLERRLRFGGWIFGGFGDEEKTAGNLSTSLSKDANALGKLHQGIFHILLNQWSHPISICQMFEMLGQGIVYVNMDGP